MITNTMSNRLEMEISLCTECVIHTFGKSSKRHFMLTYIYSPLPAHCANTLRTTYAASVSQSLVVKIMIAHLSSAHNHCKNSFGQGNWTCISCTFFGKESTVLRQPFFSLQVLYSSFPL